MPACVCKFRRKNSLGHNAARAGISRMETTNDADTPLALTIAKDRTKLLPESRKNKKGSAPATVVPQVANKAGIRCRSTL